MNRRKHKTEQLLLNKFDIGSSHSYLQLDTENEGDEQNYYVKVRSY